MNVVESLPSSSIPRSDPRDPRLPATLRTRIEREFSTRWRDQWGGKFILHGRPPSPGAVRLDGNDYLSVTGHPRIVQAQVNSLRADREAVVQSGVFLLDDHPARAFEKAMAAWLGKDDTFLCQSGYAANLALLQIVADAATPVYLDSLAHMSLWEGARMAKAPAHAFRHNEPAHLERMLHAHGPGVVVVDSVYSTTGALCPLERMIEVAERHDCIIVVDESHSLGTHGPHGRGLCAQLGLTHRVHFITASLAKAFAGRAGIFTLPREMRHYAQSSAYVHIFSSSLLPHEIAGLAATLELIVQAGAERERLRATTRRLRSSFAEAGYPIHQGTEQIIALEAGTEPEVMRVRDAFEESGVFGAIFCAPATSTRRALLRLTLNAGLTESEIAHIERTARDAALVLKPWEWAAARRQRNRSSD
jgi:7-keto-8-aminopelargonate synthetase-like enzyme